MTSIEECALDLSPVENTRSEIELASLVTAYSAFLFRVAHSILRSRADAEDVVQDVFVRVLRNQRSLPEVRDMRVWLVRIAWNLAIDRRRRIRPDQLDENFAHTLAANHLPADEALGEAQRMRRVFAELEKLPEKERHALLLSAIEELSISEMAQILGRSESAVRALLFRARTRLRERLGKGEKMR